MPDKIQVNASLSALDNEAAVEPFRFALSRNKIITFPHPEELDWAKAEQLISLMQDTSSTATDVFELWLSEKDFAALRAEGLKIGQIRKLSDLVVSYYQDIFGTPGN